MTSRLLGLTLPLVAVALPTARETLFATLGGAAPTTCYPAFDHQADQIATNNKCWVNTGYQASNALGAATVTYDYPSAAAGQCAYTTAVQCGNTEMRMPNIAAIEMDFEVVGGMCNQDWAAVYMFEYNDQPGGDWHSYREIDLAEVSSRELTLVSNTRRARPLRLRSQPAHGHLPPTLSGCFPFALSPIRLREAPRA